MAVYVSKNIVYNAVLIEAAVSAFKTVPGGALMLTPKLQLFTNDFTPLPLTPLAGFTEADFSGYVKPTVVLSGPVNLTANAAAMVSSSLFLATTASPFIQNTIRGWYLTDGTPTVWYAAERFTNPVAIASAGDFLEVNLGFPLPFMLGVFP